MIKNTLIPGVVVHGKMSQLMIPKNTKPDQNIREWPFDYIYYSWYGTDGGFIVYQEMYDESKNKQLNRMFIPEAMIEDFIVLMAGEKLSE